MQTQLRVAVARQGRVVDERWLPPARGRTDRRSASIALDLRGIGVAGASLSARPTHDGTEVGLPPGAIGEWCAPGGEVQPLDGRQAMDVTLSRGARAWVRVGDSVVYLQQVVRPPPPPPSTLPRGIALGREPLDRRLLLSFAFASLVAAVLIVTALRRPGFAHAFDVQPSPPAAAVFHLPPAPPPRVDPAPVKVTAAPAPPRPERPGRPDPAVEPPDPGEVREKVRRSGVLGAIRGEAFAGLLEQAPVDRPLLTFAGVRPVDPASPGRRGLPGPARGPMVDVVLTTDPPPRQPPILIEHPLRELPKSPPIDFDPPPPPTLDPVPSDEDAARVYAYAKKRLGSLRHCQEKRMRRLGAPLGGRVTLQFSVDATGRLSGIELGEGSLHDDELDACLVGVLRTWKVTPPPTRDVDVELPVVFSAGR